MNGLILALKDVQREIRQLEGKIAADKTLSKDQAAELGRHLLELTHALRELSSAYETHRRAHPSLPSVGDLLASS